MQTDITDYPPTITYGDHVSGFPGYFLIKCSLVRCNASAGDGRLFLCPASSSSGKKADEWTDAMNKATEGMSAEIIQSVSDEGIIHHVEKDPGARHSPDLFHVQQELVRGTAVALESKKKKAGKVLEEAVREVYG